MILAGKIALVTGSSKGIGKAVALKFAENGARVVINSRSSIEEGQKVVEEIKKLGGDAVYIQANVEDPGEIKTLFSKTMDEYGRLDILVNNAGASASRPFLETDENYWVSVLKNNFLSAVYCSIEAARIMKAQGSGKIINTSSIRGFEHSGRPGNMAYCAAKAAINSFTKNLAKELAPNITVNAVAPGFVSTPYVDGAPEGVKKAWLSETLIKRFIEPGEIADAYLYLASTNVVTGEILVADGGFNLKIEPQY
jgi:3-oxoacyl-[acyl-carrier protein] reductase